MSRSPILPARSPLWSDTRRTGASTSDRRRPNTIAGLAYREHLAKSLLYGSGVEALELSDRGSPSLLRPFARLASRHGDLRGRHSGSDDAAGLDRLTAGRFIGCVRGRQLEPKIGLRGVFGHALADKIHGADII